MQANRRHQTGTRILFLIGLVVGLLALAACQPIQDPAVIAARATSMAAGRPVASEEAADEGPEVAPATATITADSLRVRETPSDDAEVVAGVRGGETYDVIGISSDGAWIQIEIDRSPSGTGWVSANFVTLEGDITNIATVDVDTGEPAATEEPAEEATPEPTEEMAEEATPEPTEEMTEEATPEPTEEMAEEATPEPTEEMAEEATPEPTEEPTEEAVDAGLGTVTIVTDLPLRVRSAPTTEEDNKVGNVFDGDVYTVLEISEDGLWVRIDVPELDLPDGGWVSAEYVVFDDAE